MADQAALPGVDQAIPNVAGMWDYYLGGNENTDADREAARLVLGAAPDVPLAALENREFLKHAVRFLAAESGICQFIDIGPGLPTRGNVHQLAREHNPHARVAYVDNDPVVLTRGRAYLDGLADVILIPGDLRDPGGILGHPELRRIIDFSQPVALSMTLLLHFVRDEEDPYGCVARLCDALCPGSCLVISHVTLENRDEAALGQIAGAYDQATAPMVMRTKVEVERLSFLHPELSQAVPRFDMRGSGSFSWLGEFFACLPNTGVPGARVLRPDNDQAGHAARRAANGSCSM